MSMAHEPLESRQAAEQSPEGLDRRALLIGGGAAALGLVGYSAFRSARKPKAATFIAKGQAYGGDLVRTIADGLAACGLVPDQWRGKRVLLKPNLVEPTRDCPHMTTHPAMIVATAEVFRRWGASVKVGEAPGHVRDTELALVESGVQEALDDARLEFADLNYEDAGWVDNAGRASALKGLYFPRTVLEADLMVSLPKLKTHHWVGMTASMKNLYGLLPGIKYGWPKNVLHHAGIPQTVVDINASVPRTVAVVDAIDCMEGDGPIMGSLKQMGLVVIGTNLPAVDATCARLMGLRPQRINYLRLAADELGPIDQCRIQQRGERWQQLASPFSILDVPHLNGLRAEAGELVT
jgi:uncharacterized protein (DUF362 family)